MGFLLLWSVISVLLYHSFKTSLTQSFDQQLRARASIIAQKTSLHPRIVPLPQGKESFTIIFSDGFQRDTLFTSVSATFPYPVGADSTVVNKQWRVAKIITTPDNEGTLQVIYGQPGDGFDRSIREVTTSILIILPFGTLMAVLLGFWMAGKMLQPVRRVVRLADQTNLNTQITLIDDPETSTELKELTTSFNRMLLRIQEQSNRQTAFFASASHELRTPLSIMQTRLEVLMKDKNAPDPGLYAGQLDEVRRLIRMVNDFLLLSQVTAGNLSAASRDCHLAELLNETVLSKKEKAEAHGLTFRIVFQPAEEDFMVLSDEDKLTIILNNLLDNAVKYAADASIVLVTVTKQQGGIHLGISNTIRSDIQPNIARLGNEFYHEKPLGGEGFGLGLWISRQLTDYLNIGLRLEIKDNRFFEAELSFPEK